MSVKTAAALLQLLECMSEHQADSCLRMYLLVCIQQHESLDVLSRNYIQQLLDVVRRHKGYVQEAEIAPQTHQLKPSYSHIEVMDIKSITNISFKYIIACYQGIQSCI